MGKMGASAAGGMSARFAFCGFLGKAHKSLSSRFRAVRFNCYNFGCLRETGCRLPR